MSKFIFVYKNEQITGNEKLKINELVMNFHNSNIHPNKPYVNSDLNSILAVYNPISTLKVNKTSVCLGNIGRIDDWDTIPYNEIDGTFLLVRNSPSCVELVTDVLATRSIWYYYDSELFIASSSQRMIIMYLSNFDFNENAISWFLSNGILGPNMSWDKRIRLVPPNTCVQFHKDTFFTNEISIENSKFVPLSKRCEYKQALREKIDSSILDMEYNANNFAVLLSGGYDSRYILTMLTRKHKVKTITWGTKNSENVRGSDANVAKRLSSIYKTEHKYLESFNLQSLKESEVMNLFIRYGEGRTDEISGYLDGFKLYNDINDSGIEVLVRGDESFGWNKSFDEVQTRYSLGLSQVSDLPILDELFEKSDFVRHVFPDRFKKGQNESITAWRDRLYRIYRIPTFLAGLNDLKLSHVEIVNPLISKDILAVICSMPDNLRTDKSLFKSIVRSTSAKIKYANKSSNISTDSFVNRPSTIELIKDRLAKGSEVFDDEFLKSILSKLNEERITNQSTFYTKTISYIKRLLPRPLKSFIKRRLKYNSLNIGMISYRVYLVMEIFSMLSNDAKRLSVEKNFK